MYLVMEVSSITKKKYVYQLLCSPLINQILSFYFSTLMEETWLNICTVREHYIACSLIIEIKVMLKPLNTFTLEIQIFLVK